MGGPRRECLKFHPAGSLDTPSCLTSSATEKMVLTGKPTAPLPSKNIQLNRFHTHITVTSLPPNLK